MVPHRELLVLFWSDHGENIETVTLNSIRMASIRGTTEPEVCFTDSIVMIMIMKVATIMNLSFCTSLTAINNIDSYKYSTIPKWNKSLI